MRILIVEDEQHLADGLKFNLEAEGFETKVTADGEQADACVGSEKFDAVILDVMLPGIDGFEVARRMRERGDYTPVLMLTALGRPEDVMNGFASGADDYLAKPFDLGVFLARVNGLLRRRKWQDADTAPAPAIIINDRTIDTENLELRYDGISSPVTLMEARLLGYLHKNAGRAVSRAELLKNVWNLTESTDTRAIDNFVVRIRRLIGDNTDKPAILQTVRGIGYKLVS